MYDCEIGTAATGHRVQARVGKSAVAFSCRWLIDATGRTRQIGKKIADFVKQSDSDDTQVHAWQSVAQHRPPTD